MRSRGFLCVASRRPDQPRPYSVQRALEGLRPCLVRPRRAGARSNRAPADFPCPRTPPSTKAYAGQPPASLPMDLLDAPEVSFPRRRSRSSPSSPPPAKVACYRVSRAQVAYEATTGCLMTDGNGRLKTAANVFAM
ncbi:uncharacterized protein [Aegilops tauschii subsp. strangulata]|uniref:uncharacterized protein isoform X1 n=1 Tax=Aegilops tauschii subsp. strangulata TaxID=200361 RepID=UPI00098AB062|nr:uncharacterized protein LOC109782493 isoform X3 [Aegilops tauschii subsp. strangulata]